ncbi:protein ECT2 isoform X2 [Belonocnema kinseyi]|uniref:protein ECT2 isoform X2 n=1 Tax=Belonocnema kinseyi TaxID=2817044 RepID=UPI00143D0A1C|nr:protein ECT2 isoform X2 [Belonocnema kinseyi]
MEERSVHSSISDINSEEAARSEPLILPRKKRICLVGAASEDPALGAAAQQFSVPVLKSQTGIEHLEDTAYCTYFILKHFEGHEYEVLHKSAHRILGPTALVQLAEKKESLPSNNRPMFTQAMKGTVVVFTGFRMKDELTKLINMIHNMGGSIRKEMGAKVTHLIANCCGGEKYRYAVTFRVPIMSMNWVTALWDMREDVTCYGINEELIAACKLKPFYGAKVCFFGFPEEEKKHMCEVLQQQGGEPTEIDDPSCTHVVNNLGKNQCRITDSANNTLPYFKNPCYSLEVPLLKSKAQSFPFAYYDPYTNTIPSLETYSRQTDSEDSNPNDLQKGLNIFQREENLSENSLNSATTPIKNNAGGDLSVISSPDSAICMDFTSSSISISEKSSVIFSCLRAKIESSIDLSSLSKISWHSKDSGYSPLCRISLKKISCNLSLRFTDDKHLMEVDEPETCERRTIVKTENRERIDDRVDFWNLGKIRSKTLFASSSQKAVTPRRYVKWRKSKSSVNITKSPKSRKAKFKKFHSQSNLNIRRSRYLSKPDSSSSALVLVPQSNKKFPKSLKLSNSFFAKICNVVLPSTFKQYMQVSPMHQSPEKNVQRQKYTPMPSPLPVPAKIARLSNSDIKSTITLTPDRKIACQNSSASLNLRSVKAGRSRKEDKSFFVVVDESNVNALPDLASVRAHIVKAEWFWTSVQNEGAADEKEYLFEDYLESVLSPSVSARRDSQQAATPTTASTRRKRKRLAETISSLVQNGTDSPTVYKRRSSISDAGHLSVSGSFLDCTASPDKQLLDDIPEVEVNTEAGRKNLSPRHQVFLELVQTESNYVGILSTIMTLFKSPLEDLIEKSGELLNSTEAKIIFGNFPPIYEVHKKMLEELRYNAAHWTEDVSIGNVFLRYAPDLLKAYPPYVNFFENTKDMLEECDQNKPRFHAFLKICQTKPECGRQSLKELLIKPVQRLPSISLLLNDILKHTNKNNPDHGALELSISSIKEVMTYINEDKRKTEGQLAMFDIFNEIDNCPPHLVSSHRSFIGKCDVVQVSEGLSGRGDHLVLFLFTDTLEICKKRSKTFNQAKTNHAKPYKHIQMLSLSTIKKVVDIRETDECHKVFTLMVRSNQELKEKLFTFTITDEDVNKTNYLRTLCRQMANTVCKADADTFLISADSHQLQIDTSDVALGTLSKAFKSLFHNFYLDYMDPYVFLLNSMCETTLHVPLPFASSTKMKVGRAFSFNKTPSKLKRAMSTMMSPFGSTHSLTPTSQQLAQMRLASCNNINELGNGGPGSQNRDEVLMAPMSVQPTRKAKCSTLSMASLRRNCSEEVQDKSDI